MRLHLKRLSIWPVIKVTFMVSLVLGFVFGLLYALFLAFIMAVGSAFEPYGAEELGMASAGIIVVLVPIFMAFFMAIMYTLMALISVIIYNFVARTMGGLEYDVEVLEEGLSRQGESQRVPQNPSQPTRPEPGDTGSSSPGEDEPPTNYSI